MKALSAETQINNPHSSGINDPDHEDSIARAAPWDCALLNHHHRPQLAITLMANSTGFCHLVRRMQYACRM